MCRKLFILLLVIGICSCLSLTANAADLEGISYKNWCVYRDTIKKDPSLKIYYTFEETNNDFVFDGESEWVDGRWPEKRAARVDSNSLFASPYNIENKNFTCEMWIRKNGAGEKRGNDNLKSGTIIGVVGWTTGWRIVTDCEVPNGTISFYMGAPAPINAIGITSKSVTDCVWHHLVATWDGKAMKLYIDGVLDTEGNYAEEYVPYTGTNFDLRIGYSRFGVGSVKLDVDEVAIYNRVLSDEEIKNHSHQRGEIENSTITIIFPEERYRYFPLGMKLPVEIKIPANSGPSKEYKANISLTDADNKEIFTADAEKIFTTSANKGTTAIFNIVPEKCGVFWLTVSLKDEEGNVIKQQTFCFAVIVDLPPISSVTTNSPLGGNPLAGDVMPEGRFVGMKWDRISNLYFSCWCNIELEPGRFFWDRCDKLIEEADKAGNAILFTILFTPGWASSAPSVEELCKDRRISSAEAAVVRQAYPAKDMKDWDNFIRQLVRRYKEKIHYWEIWNEPNADTFQANGDTAEAYVQLLKVAYKAIHEEDPTAKVVGIVSAGVLHRNWVENVLEKGGGPYFDILAVHNYMGSMSPIESTKKRREIEKLHALVFKYLGKQVPVWDTESGIFQASRIKGRPMNKAQFLEKYRTIPGMEEGIWWVLPEHYCACWETQHAFLEFAEGIEKKFLFCSEGISTLGVAKNYAKYPTEKGVAYAAMAKVVTNRENIEKRELGTSNVVCIIVKDKEKKNTAVIFSDEETTVYLSVKENRVFKGMDFLGNPLEWRSENNLLPVKARMEPIYIFDVPSDLSGRQQILKIKIQSPIVKLDKPSKGELIISNSFEGPLTAKVEVLLPKDWQAYLDSGSDISLSSGEIKIIPFTLSAPSAPRGKYKIQFQMAEKNGNIIAREEQEYFCEGSFEALYEAKRPIKVDGDTADWEGIGEERVDTLGDKNVIGQPNPMFPKDFTHWEGPVDLSCTIKTTWRYDDGIYLLIKVVDDKLDIPPVGEEKNVWRWDCVEVFFDGRSSEEQDANSIAPTTGAEQSLIIPQLSEEPAKCKVLFSKEEPLISVDFVGRRTKEGYLVEGKISPRKGSSFTLVPGRKFGLDVAVDDAGSTFGIRKTQMVWHGDMYVYQDTSTWGRFMLSGISYKNWCAYRDTLKKDPSLKIYYTFEETNNDFAFDGEPERVEGRWTEKQAPSFDSNSLFTSPYNIENKNFTCEMWIRKNGAGEKRGVDDSKNGTIIGVVGWTTGWRIVTDCEVPNGTISFYMGAPAPINAIGITSKSVTDNVWHHLVATWDGKAMKLYIDGVLDGGRDYLGNYVPYLDSQFKLRIGYSQLGYGSVKLDVDEVAIYNRVLSAEEIKNHRYLKLSDTNHE